MGGENSPIHSCSLSLEEEKHRLFSLGQGKEWRVLLCLQKTVHTHLNGWKENTSNCKGGVVVLLKATEEVNDVATLFFVGRRFSFGSSLGLWEMGSSHIALISLFEKSTLHSGLWSRSSDLIFKTQTCRKASPFSNLLP